jgi:pyruvate dehydrogenase E2 component (dihydrolipoamide acetyltransferase)
MSDFVMPSLGADMEKATVTEWLVKPGSVVKKGDVVAVVETHKGAIEVEIFQDGVVTELCAREGEDVPVGGLLARLSSPGAPAPSVMPAIAERPPPPSPALRVDVAAEAARPRVAAERPKVSPAARRRAAELGIDPERLVGSGIDASVTLADVELAAGRQPQPVVAEAPAEPRRQRALFDPVEMRRAIAAAMSRSKREIPHYYLATSIDLGNALAWLTARNAERPPNDRILPAVLLLKAVALAIRESPQLNGFWMDDAFHPGNGVHIGWAVALRGAGLVAPAIHDVDKQSLVDLMAGIRDVAGRARGGGLRSSELSDPTVTVSSLGDQGADSLLGVIYPPQVAIIGFGRIAQRPWVRDGQVEARPLISVSLAADHRASDGHLGGLFLNDIERRLQEPETL